MYHVTHKVFATCVLCSVILPFDMKTPTYQSLSKLLSISPGFIRIYSSLLTLFNLIPIIRQ